MLLIARRLLISSLRRHQIILAFVSLYNLLGWSAFCGVAVMLVSLPLNAAIARYQKRLQVRQMAIKDKRTRLMNEILSNIKSIKLYSWERAFRDKVLDVRNNEELPMIRRIGVINVRSPLTSAALRLPSRLTDPLSLLAGDQRLLLGEHAVHGRLCDLCRLLAHLA